MDSKQYACGMQIKNKLQVYWSLIGGNRLTELKKTSQQVVGKQNTFQQKSNEFQSPHKMMVLENCSRLQQMLKRELLLDICVSMEYTTWQACKHVAKNASRITSSGILKKFPYSQCKVKLNRIERWADTKVIDIWDPATEWWTAIKWDPNSKGHRKRGAVGTTQQSHMCSLTFDSNMYGSDWLS